MNPLSLAINIIYYDDKIYFHLLHPLTNILWATRLAQWYLLVFSEALNAVINTPEQHYYKTLGGREGERVRGRYKRFSITIWNPVNFTGLISFFSLQSQPFPSLHESYKNWKSN